MSDDRTLRATVPADCAGLRLDQALARLFGDYSRSLLKQWLLDGRVLLDGRQVRPRTAVAGGERIELQPAPAAADEPGWAAQAAPFAIVHEDADLIVLDKPAGLVVHPGAGNPDPTLLNALLAHAPEVAGLPRAGIVHRLDKDTSGLMVVARSRRAHTRLVAALRDREVTRVYDAIVRGRLVSGATIDAPVGRDPRHRTRMAVTAGGRKAVTHYRVLQRYAHFSRVEVRLETGRTHQIRVHLAHAGHPLVGDPVYGGRARLPAGAGAALLAALRAFHRQALHATRLAFAHPADGRPLEFSAPPPADYAALLEVLAREDSP